MNVVSTIEIIFAINQLSILIEVHQMCSYIYFFNIFFFEIFHLKKNNKTQTDKTLYSILIVNPSNLFKKLTI